MTTANDRVEGRDAALSRRVPLDRRVRRLARHLLKGTNMEPKIDVEPDAWATKTMCIGPQYGKIRYDKLPIQCTQPGYYTHEKLYSEKTVIGLMKAAYYNGYTDREEELRKMHNV